MFERVRARKTEKGVAVFMRAYGTIGGEAQRTVALTGLGFASEPKD
jgi:hypothetical protein